MGEHLRLGVAWVHVRLDARPRLRRNHLVELKRALKYDTHTEYREAPGS